MAKRSAALARSPRPEPNSNLQPRSGRRTRPTNGVSLERAGAPSWNELEQAFFDAAPPDEPAHGAEAEHFDDLDEGQQTSGARRAWAIAAAAMRRLIRRA